MHPTTLVPSHPQYVMGGSGVHASMQVFFAAHRSVTENAQTCGIP
jgi:hypothetical protein